MKKVWADPLAAVEAFKANEAVSACVESKDTYYFNCDAPPGPVFYHSATSGRFTPTLQATGFISPIIGIRYMPCAKIHEAGKDDVFTRGFIDTNRDNKYTSGTDIPCIIWLVDGTLNGELHCCTNLDLSSYSKNLS